MKQPGICFVCGCIDAEGCDEGCAWANRQHTLCTACKELPDAQRQEKRDVALGELEMRLESAKDHVLELRTRLRTLATEPLPSSKRGGRAKRAQHQQPMYGKARS